MINKILATIDGYESSQNIFDTAVFLARRSNARLMFVHILSEKDSDYPILPTYAYYAVLKNSDEGLFQQKFDEYEHQQEKLLSSLTQKAIAAGVDAEYTQLNGIPGWEICELADIWSADLILVGSRGLKGLKEMFLGSVSNYITHHAPCSVLLVRNDTDLVSHSVDMPDEEQTEVDSKQRISNQN